MPARRLLSICLPLALLVVVAGAFVRLSDAGLGCPDWPGCYGQLIGVADADTAAAQYPDSEYDRKKAWIEVSHRYIAGLLGLLVLAAAVVDWRVRRRVGLPQWLLLFVAAQALLGMLTVTDKLRPIVVVAHLLGGMLILALLAAAVARRPLSVTLSAEARRQLTVLWAAAFAALLVQIALGGWVSSNYAALACPDFPRCQGGWLPPTMDFSAFQPTRELHQGADGQPITAAALATIHWTHRLGALIAGVFVFAFAIQLWRRRARGAAAGLMVFFILQVLLGIANAVGQVPLAVAVMHNAVAAILIVNFAVLRVKLRG